MIQKKVLEMLSSRRGVQELLAKLGRLRSSAVFVGVTGSSGKSSTVTMLSHVLAGLAPVRAQILSNRRRSCIQSLRSIRSEHRYVVCELGVSGPGRLQPMLDLVKPSVGVVTLVALEHYSAFRTLDAVADEKRKLVEALPKTGLAVLNRDDPRVLAMAAYSEARVVTFGTSRGEYQITQTRAPAPGKLTVIIVHAGETFEIKTQLTGAHNSLPLAAAFACAHELGAPPKLILDRLASFKPLFGRCSTHCIENGPVFIADTTKAPYHSIYLPIEMLRDFIAPRKRIIIGNISDYPGASRPKYRDVYRACRLIADQVIFVGEHAPQARATADEIVAERFIEKQSVKEAAEFVRETAIPGEIILLKGSKNLHLERILLNFEHEVRCWAQACGMKENCLGCGLYAFPFGQPAQTSQHTAGFVSTFLGHYSKASPSARSQRVPFDTETAEALFLDLPAHAAFRKAS
jgi:UDP-N-acetylmuramoyl-tripeptide--D-alanyl-D-alanine ligase